MSAVQSFTDHHRELKEVVANTVPPLAVRNMKNEIESTSQIQYAKPAVLYSNPTPVTLKKGMVNFALGNASENPQDTQTEKHA
jgi:hypothetical protein